MGWKDADEFDWSRQPRPPPTAWVVALGPRVVITSADRRLSEPVEHSSSELVERSRISNRLAENRALALSAGQAALVRRHARNYFVLRDRARVLAGRVFARVCATAAFTIALSACSSSFSF